MQSVITGGILLFVAFTLIAISMAVVEEQKRKRQEQQPRPKHVRCTCLDCGPILGRVCDPLCEVHGDRSLAKR